MDKNINSGINLKLRGALAICLVLLALLFFLPWISSNMNSNVLTSYKNINGMNISQYASLLAELASGSNARLIGLGLAIIKFIYLLPALAAISLLLLFIDKKTGAAVGILTSILHIGFAAIYFLLPASYAELRDLMFITTPTLHLYLYISIISFALSAIILSGGQEKQKERGGRTKKKIHDTAPMPSVKKALPKEKKRSKISVSKKQ